MVNRKVLRILIFIVSLGYFSNASYASDQVTVYLTSNQKKVDHGEEIEITVNIENSKVAACNFSIYFEEEKFEFVSDLIPEDSAENVKVDGNKINFVWFDKHGGKEAKEGKIASFKFRAKENGKFTFTINGEFYNQKGQLINTNFKTEQVQIGKEEDFQKQEEEKGVSLENTNCYLQTLRINIQGLVPDFEKDVEEYYLVVPNEVQDLEILAVSENPNANVEIKGNNNLKEERNDIEIKVTSPDKTQSKVYNIHVSKTNNLELANTNLETLAIENTMLNPPFDSLQTNYQVEVSNQTESINILAVPENEQATVQIIGKDNLREGGNVVTILVKAVDGFTEKSYKINVNRRNSSEEEKYKQEQKKQIEALENAYKIEKTSADIINPETKSTEKKKLKYQAIKNWIIVMLVLIAVATLASKVIKSQKLGKK